MWNINLKNAISFTLGAPKVKYLDINLTKYIWDLYEENYKTLIKKWKMNEVHVDIPYLCMGSLNIGKTLVLPNLTHQFNTIEIKLPSYFVDFDKVILKFLWKDKRPRIANTILKEKNKVRGLKLPDFKTCYKAIVIETVWY